MKKNTDNNEDFAVIQTGGKQYTVKAGDKVLVEKLGGSAGDEVTFDQVLLVKQGENSEVKIGVPTVEGSKVTGRILGESKAKKVLVFKKKRRKGYKRKQGHRQQLTEVHIERISA